MQGDIIRKKNISWACQYYFMLFIANL